MTDHLASSLPGGRRYEPVIQARAEGLYLGASRSLLYSQVAVEMLRQQLFHQLGEDLARAILAQAGRHGGFNDAQLLLQEHSFDGLEAMVEAQYGVLSTNGFGSFEVRDLVVNRASGEAYVRVRCRNSPEAESHRRLFGPALQPACCHLVGYSSGWASAMTGMKLLTIETRCVAKGDECCELETLPYEDFVGPEAAFWKSAFESTSLSLSQELKEKLTTIEKQMAVIEQQRTAIIEQQRAALVALAAPILQIADGILALPVIGAVDVERAAVVTERLLAAIVAHRVRGVIIDVTGVDEIDAQTAQYLSRLSRSARLLGVRVVVSGISPSIAQVLVAQDIQLFETATCRTLQDGVRILQGATLKEAAQ